MPAQDWRANHLPSTLDEQLLAILTPLAVEVEGGPTPAGEWSEGSPLSQQVAAATPDLSLHCLLLFCGAVPLTDVSVLLQQVMREECFTEPLSTNQGYGPEGTGYLIVIADESFPLTLLTRLRESAMITGVDTGIIRVFE